MTKLRKLELALTDAINKCMEEENMRVHHVAGLLNTTPNRAMAAVMGLEWSPTLREVARVEAAFGEKILTVPPNEEED